MAIDGAMESDVDGADGDGADPDVGAAETDQVKIWGVEFKTPSDTDAVTE
jgi:hypothetical protein